ncbi:MAG TPA: hypothetical protein VKS60_09040 [Stellaceae bacterium]|nr:hypothetical protein [Stellaceae bacterium]
MGSQSKLAIAGAIIALLGVLAIAVPMFTTEHREDVARIGDVHITANEKTTHVIPPFVGPTILAIGVLLIGTGLVVRR